MDQQTLACTTPTPKEAEGNAVPQEPGKGDVPSLPIQQRAGLPSGPSGEQLLDDFTRQVEAMVNGRPTAVSSGRDAAIDALTDAICRAPWKTPEGRGLAQHLLARLWLARGRGSHAP
jgi:hypothetical protein